MMDILNILSYAFIILFVPTPDNVIILYKSVNHYHINQNQNWKK